MRHRCMRVRRGRAPAGLVGDTCHVDVLGGALTVALGDTVRLGGPVVHVFDVDVDIDAARDAVRVGR